MSVNWLAKAGGPIRGRVRVPGDKSISHRALMLAAIAEGSSRISGFLEGEDTRATARILQQLGVRIEAPGNGERLVHGVGLHGLVGSSSPLDCGNAGTGMRLMAGLLAGQAFASTLVGDASLSARPMGRVIRPLTEMGARIGGLEGGLPPIRIEISNGLQAIDFKPEIASAQLKSAVLLAGLYAQGETCVREPRPTRDYTEKMLRRFGWPLRIQGGEIRLSGGHKLHATDIDVPGDFSSAAFLIVAATLVPGSELLLESVGVSQRRTGLLTALRLMGADIVEENRRAQGDEPVADLRVRHAALHGVKLPVELVPDMIDEFPVLFVAAALASGETFIQEIGELRVKESDRLSTMARSLAAIGVEVEEGVDSLRVYGGKIRGGVVDSRGDHRIAMAMAVAAQRAADELRIADCANVDTSFPGFLGLATGSGFGLRIESR
ncbi:MAG: 3-phosphoshikimate 1-carboxyvinyltransferase [Arenimonas sp.]